MLTEVEVHFNSLVVFNIISSPANVSEVYKVLQKGRKINRDKRGSDH